MLRRRNPAAKLLAALLVAAALVPVLDPVTAGAVLAAVVLVLPFAGLRARPVLLLFPPLLLAAASVAVVNLLYGDAGAAAALGLGLRLAAIALPCVLAVLTSDPTETADALVQRLRVPERPALGVLAALRLVPLLAEQWRTLTLARRARGLEAGANPAAAVRLFAGKVFALLVRAVRTGTRLAAAMDARAFGTGPRTHARRSVWTAADTALVAGTAAVLAGAHGLSLWLGTWRLLFA
ncbi:MULTISPECIES: energy-coupling factor transporter transmembrane component T [Nocardiopsis]|uniref:energy-coupling factor transporter transmembrane component T n=1 Tax=Nocardiopsis TaxID=2013 RepID=UPI000348945B|nr:MULTISPECIES: energy-coupling factor transporter transmembrane component T [Nocardiopsis]